MIAFDNITSRAREAHGGAVRPLPRTMDARHLNAVANASDVRPALGQGVGVLDFGPALEDPAQFLAFADERGGFLVQAMDAARYELHTLLNPEARGACALALCRHVLRYLFTATSCSEVVTRVPGNLPAADFMARRVGFRRLWSMDKAWPGPDGELVSLSAFGLSLDDWMAADPELVAEGEAFHDMLRAAAAAAGDPSPALHPHEDETHERAAGMACLMAKAGNHHKAAWAYGRWAQLAGYGPLNLISEQPALYETGGTVIAASGGALEVLKWSQRQ